MSEGRWLLEGLTGGGGGGWNGGGGGSAGPYRDGEGGGGGGGSFVSGTDRELETGVASNDGLVTITWVGPLDGA